LHSSINRSVNDFHAAALKAESEEGPSRGFDALSVGDEPVEARLGALCRQQAFEHVIAGDERPRRVDLLTAVAIVFVGGWRACEDSARPANDQLPDRFSTTSRPARRCSA
jgi:hypothetical protein